MKNTFADFPIASSRKNGFHKAVLHDAVKSGELMPTGPRFSHMRRTDQLLSLSMLLTQ